MPAPSSRGPSPSGAPPAGPDAGVPGTASAEASTEQVRGSSVLLFGRMISLALNLVSQVLVVRYLSTSEYGLFAYGLSVAAFLQLVVSLGQEKSITRFLSLYDERGRPDQLLGTIWLYVGTVIAATAVAVVAMSVVVQVAGPSLDVPMAEAVILVLVLTSPLDALDKLLEGMFAVFSSPRAIFIRKYVLQPVAKLAVIGLLVLTSGTVLFLAVGQVVAGLLGLGLYLVQVPAILRARGLHRHLGRRKTSVPYREVLWFAVPLLGGELVYLSMNTVSVVILGAFHDAAEVGAYRAIFPAARLNQVVMFSFAMLFLPLATRLFARDDDAGMRHAYWQTAGWLAVLSFPVVAVTIPLAEPTTVLLFGERYAGSAPYLAILSTGFYLSTALGFNQQTLQVYGRVRWVVVVSVVAAVAGVGLSFLLIPPFGALGVALANGITLVLQNTMNQWGLGRLTPVGSFSGEFARVYLSVLLGVVGLGALQLLVGLPALPAIAVAAAMSLLVLRSNRSILQIESTFPEVLKIPVLRRLLT